MWDLAQKSAQLRLPYDGGWALPITGRQHERVELFLPIGRLIRLSQGLIKGDYVADSKAQFIG